MQSPAMLSLGKALGFTSSAQHPTAGQVRAAEYGLAHTGQTITPEEVADAVGLDWPHQHPTEGQTKAAEWGAAQPAGTTL